MLARGFQAAPPDTAMAARDGLLAAAVGTERLALLRIADAATLWERHLEGVRIAHVWMTDSAVVAADAWLQHVYLIDRGDGALLGRMWFRQPDPESPFLVRLLRSGGVICGPDCSAQSDGAVAYDLTTGERLWRVALDKPLAQLFPAQEGSIGFGLLGGDVRIVGADTGQALFNGRIPRAHFAFDGIVSDGTLVVKFVGAQGTPAPPELAAFDLATGDNLWHRADLTAAMATLSTQIVARRIPVVLRTDSTEQGTRRSSSVALLDPRTGENVGPAVMLPFTDAGARFSGDLRVYAGGILAGTTNGTFALPTEIVPDGAENDL
jgi:hypothetical protein